MEESSDIPTTNHTQQVCIKDVRGRQKRRTNARKTYFIATVRPLIILKKRTQDRVSMLKNTFCPPCADKNSSALFGTSVLQAFSWHFRERFALDFRYLEYPYPVHDSRVVV
ncbi:hypothetical protein BOTBODRAFT_616513 [Botryobasidium botryosum FD-172 SS1]|uniref:Uncharacterized protein n=1 Tax=Botryobasidium botryosum (strain FD-172 SS1) TaxID=930990 RepID=A0A067LXP8_BOTB1|nr:hypothetical protein BOTBODRAFT_616513 [Botryobasidium botryosum FD-172 SS1]